MRHDSTRIYQRSLELVTLVAQVIDQLPQGYGFLADQLRRAVSSITLNFSEGFGKGTAREQARYFRISRGSAYEVSATLDVAHCFHVISEAHLAHGTARWASCVSMTPRRTATSNTAATS